MCSNYRPVTRLDRLLTFFGVERRTDQAPPDVDVYPTGAAPFLRLLSDGGPEGQARLTVEDGLFGLLPSFATEVKFGRHTYNARCETVASKASFREAWAKGQRCIVPAEFIYEPCYESGKMVRWRIGQAGAVPLGIAGIYREWTQPATGRKTFTFAMITVNADQHPVFSRMHKPGEEKRMPVILSPDDYRDWLTCSVSEAPRFFQAWTGDLEAAPSPAPPGTRTRRPRGGPLPGEDEDTPDMFAS